VQNRDGPGQGSRDKPGSAGTGEVRTFPASDQWGARQGSWSCDGEPDVYGNPRSRCPEVNLSTDS